MPRICINALSAAPLLAAMLHGSAVDASPPPDDQSPILTTRVLDPDTCLLLTAKNRKFIMMAMAVRQEEEQTEHDLVIEATVEQFASSAKYVIHPNPGTEKNVALGHQHPDIIVTERGSAKVRLVIEVETNNTVGTQELNHWRALAGLGPPLYLLTPYVALPTAERLCAVAGIKCHHGYYVKDEMGRFKVVLKRETAPPPTQIRTTPR